MQIYPYKDIKKHKITLECQSKVVIVKIIGYTFELKIL